MHIILSGGAEAAQSLPPMHALILHCISPWVGVGGVESNESAPVKPSEPEASAARSMAPSNAIRPVWTAKISLRPATADDTST